MLVRVAEGLYWMARYLERAEDTARLINANAQLVMDLPRGVSPAWRSLVTIIGSDETFAERALSDDENAVIKFMVADRAHSQSLISSISAARENARTLREILPRETWQALNTLHLLMQEKASSSVAKRTRHAFLTDIIAKCQLVSATMAGCMNRDETYQFIRIGRAIERADMTTRIVDVRSALLGTDNVAMYQNIQWVSVLRSLSAYQMYRQEQKTFVTRELALRFLLRSMRFPRAFRFTIVEVSEGVSAMPRNESCMAAIKSLVTLVDRARGGDATLEGLPKFIDRLQLGLAQLHTAIEAAYFSRQLPSQSKTSRAA